jgi:maltose alpha-D-glucosyltransferase/alpha-amylase
MSLEATSDLWWKNAVVYCVDTQAFLDTNGDGIGDLDGLTQRIDYLAGPGVREVLPQLRSSGRPLRS